MEKIHVPKGTRDILDEEIVLWYRVENIVRTMASLFDYHEIRTPLFEHTELFSRGVGEATDIVQKEMYTFTDKGGRSITLRPEGTAPVMRSFIEQGLYVSNPRIKWFYMGPMFRYERPQAGRMRQFHQFGFEALGYTSPACDAEIIFLAWTIYQEIGLKNLTLEINNLGCHQCKPQYIEVLKQFLDSHREELCENCRSRMDKNPLRILDCKEAGCQGVLHSSNFPVIQSYLCDDCRHHQDELMDNLARTGVSVIINPYLVRGLDYYIKTAFEIKTGELGSQDAIGGGGRYDHLSDTLGVKGIPGVGFAAGMERIILLLQKQIGETSFREAPLVYLAPLDHPGEMLLLSLSAVLKEHSIPFRLEFADKGIKYHLKKAEKMGISSIVIAGEEEARREIYTVKNLLTGEQNTLDQNILVTDLLGAGRHVTNT